MHVPHVVVFGESEFEAFFKPRVGSGTHKAGTQHESGGFCFFDDLVILLCLGNPSGRRAALGEMNIDLVESLENVHVGSAFLDVSTEVIGVTLGPGVGNDIEATRAGFFVKIEGASVVATDVAEDPDAFHVGEKERPVTFLSGHEVIGDRHFF